MTYHEYHEDQGVYHGMIMSIMTCIIGIMSIYDLYHGIMVCIMACIMSIILIV